MDSTGQDISRRELIGRAALAGAAAVGAGRAGAWARAPGSPATRPAATQPGKKPPQQDAVAPPPARPSRYRGPGVNLRGTPAPGRYLMTDTRQIVQNIVDAGGKRRVNKQTTTLWGAVTIGRPGASARQEVQFVCRRIAQLVTSGGRARSFDSAAPAQRQDSTMSFLWRPMIGWRGSVVVSAGGRVAGQTAGIDELMARVKPGEMLAQARSKLRGLAGSVLAALPVPAWARQAPADAALPGQAWKGEVYVSHLPVLGIVRMRCAWRLQDIEQARGGPAAEIDFLARGRVPARRVDVETVSRKLNAEVRRMTLRASGTVRMDLRTHLAADVRSVLAGQGLLWLAEPNGPAAKLKIDFTSSRHVTFERAK